MKNSVVETGSVVENADGLATVQIDRGSSCKGCGLGQMGLCKPGGAGMSLTVENLIDAKIGDRVTIGIDSGTLLKGYFYAYMLPLAALILGAFTGFVIDRWTGLVFVDVMVALLLFGFVTFWSYRALNKFQKDKKMHIKRVVNAKADASLNNTGNTEGDDYLKRFAE
ncbi:MAG: SoxR reducing system RseC family protein [Nitrospirae bacterium YQR-1]